MDPAACLGAPPWRLIFRMRQRCLLFSRDPLPWPWLSACWRYRTAQMGLSIVSPLVALHHLPSSDFLPSWSSSPCSSTLFCCAQHGLRGNSSATLLRQSPKSIIFLVPLRRRGPQVRFPSTSKGARVYSEPCCAPGHLLKLYDRQGWDFHRELLNYGPVFKLQGIFGVRLPGPPIFEHV